MAHFLTDETFALPRWPTSAASGASTGAATGWRRW